MCSSLRWLAGMVARRQVDSPTHAASLTNTLLDPYTVSACVMHAYSIVYMQKQNYMVHGQQTNSNMADCIQQCSSCSMQQETQLRSEVVALLTDHNLYLTAYGVIFPQEALQRGTFWPLIHGLARHGVYLMEGDTAVNHAVLAQNNPFREVGDQHGRNGILLILTCSAAFCHLQ